MSEFKTDPFDIIKDHLSPELKARASSLVEAECLPEPAKKVDVYTWPTTDLQDFETPQAAMDALQLQAKILDLTPEELSREERKILAVAEDKWDRRFVQLAQFISEWSKDPSTRVGAVITRDRRIVSTGYNGFPQGMSDDAALYANREEKYSRVIHGETNALIFANQSLEGATLHTWPFAPCDRCAVQMLQAGIRRFVFPKLSADKVERWGASMERSKLFFKECGATWVELPEITP